MPQKCRRPHGGANRLDVAVDHPLPVGVGDGVAHLQEEPQAVGHGQAVPVGVGVDRLAVDVLHDQIRQPFVGAAAVHQPGDVGMVKRGEDLPLRAEAREDVVGVHPALDELDRHRLGEAALSSLGPVDRAHPSPVELLHHPKRADAATFDRFRDGSARRAGRDLNEAAGSIVGVQQPLDIGSE
jgi:hypothetical protein